MTSLRLVNLLCTLLADEKGLLLSSYCAKYRIARRTAFRDMATLRKAGLPVEYDRIQGYWRMNHSLAKLPSPRGSWPLSWGETVLIMASLIRFTQDTHREADGTRIMRQLETLISDTLTDQVGSILVNARLLAANPALAVERTHGLISRF